MKCAWYLYIFCLRKCMHSPCCYILYTRSISSSFHPYLLHHVSEVYGLCATDGRSPMVVHELIKGVEFDYPQKILPCTISQHFKMLYTTSKSRQRGRGGGTEESDHIQLYCSVQTRM